MMPKEKRDKMDANSQKMVLIGYGNTAAHYRLWNPRLNKVITATKVIFNEAAKTATKV